MSMSMAEPPATSSRRGDDHYRSKVTIQQRPEVVDVATRGFSALQGTNAAPSAVKEAPPVSNDEDWCASKLVQRRRQLGQEAKQRVSILPQRSTSNEQPSGSPTHIKPEERIAKPAAFDGDSMMHKQHASTDVRGPSTTTGSTSEWQGDHSAGRFGIPHRVTTTGTDTTIRPQVEPPTADASKAWNTAAHVSKPLSNATTQRSGTQRSVPAAAKGDATVIGRAASSNQQKGDLVEPATVHDLGTRKANQERTNGGVLGYAAGNLPERRVAG